MRNLGYLFYITQRAFIEKGGGDFWMETVVGKDESLEDALRRFRRSCQKGGVMAEMKKREYYEKPSVRKKKKMEARARKKKRR